jgi:hypothetical protein
MATPVNRDPGFSPLPMLPYHSTPAQLRAIGALGSNLRLPWASMFQHHPLASGGGMRFNPYARLNPSQIRDFSYNQKLLYWLTADRMIPPLYGAQGRAPQPPFQPPPFRPPYRPVGPMPR